LYREQIAEKKCEVVSGLLFSDVMDVKRDNSLKCKRGKEYAKPLVEAKGEVRGGFGERRVSSKGMKQESCRNYS